MRALVAMSGGVDSSVAAALILEAGHEAIGVTLKQWQGAGGEMPVSGCCTVADAEDARWAAAVLDIPYYVLDYVDVFRSEVVDRFASEYRAGRTPNPCVECNRRVRFKALLARTAELGCNVLVTGHHARVRRDEDGYHLHRATDEGKDQSYVLHMLGQQELARTMFPIGAMMKRDVRAHAARLGLGTETKPDSQDLCFVGARSYRDFLRSEFPDMAVPGDIVDTEGEVVGTHDGTIDFTVGQRRGVAVAAGERRYVVDIAPATRTIVVGDRRDLLMAGCAVEEVTFVSGTAPAGRELEVQLRYRSPAVPARIEPGGEDRWVVRFREPQPGVAPGQSAVLYRGDEVLGGGIIASALREDRV
ncbi:MAG: tRNA 2-thiouridine(34) synthase MnmA [Acidimicrobiia bacterium]